MRILLVLLFFFPLAIQAEIYLWQDEAGHQHFSDQKNSQAKIVDIKPGYGFFTVKQVFDGDTVELSDGRKIRLLGINTPEIRHWEKQADAGGNEAKLWLKTRLENAKVRLVMDVETSDKYGRTLAHLFTEDKKHVNRELIESGLAEVTIYPPNLLYADELISAQNKAEQNKIGIWQREEYAPRPTSSLTAYETGGWVRLFDKITRIRPARRYVYLEFSENFEVRIERKWLSLFPDVNEYIDKTIEARGWLNNNNGRYSMLIRHPSALKIR